MQCDFCEEQASCAVEDLEGYMAYLCRGHLPLLLDAGSDWFEPEAIGAEIDPWSGLPKSRAV